MVPLHLDYNAELSSLQMVLYEHEEEGDAGVWPSALMREESAGSLDVCNVLVCTKLKQRYAIYSQFKLFEVSDASLI